jgi:hypothetical protein
MDPRVYPRLQSAFGVADEFMSKETTRMYAGSFKRPLLVSPPSNEEDVIPPQNPSHSSGQFMHADHRDAAEPTPLAWATHPLHS